MAALTPLAPTNRSQSFLWLFSSVVVGLAIPVVDSFQFKFAQRRGLAQYPTRPTGFQSVALRSSREDSPVGESPWDDEYEYDPTKPPSDVELKVFKKILVEDAKKTLGDFIDQGGFDLETYVGRHVDSIAPSSDSSDKDESEADKQHDAKVVKMEGEILDAIETENFAEAHRLDKEVSSMHVDDCGAVLQVNSRFYRAFTDKSITEMKKVWLLSPTAVCIHPATPPVVGYDQIIRDWAKLFESSDGDFQKNWIECDKIRLAVRGSMATVLCEEKVWGRRYVRGQKKRVNELINQLTSTNVFRKVGGSWFLVSHHASWHHKSELSAQIVKDRQEGQGKNREKGETADLKTGILRDFGPILGNSDSGSEKKNQQPQVKRVIMGGSLNELLNGGLDGIMDSMKKNKADSSTDSQQGQGVWHIKNNDAADDDEDDDEDDDDDSIEDDDDSDDDGMEFMEIKLDQKSDTPSSPLSLVKEWTMAQAPTSGEGKSMDTSAIIDVPKKSTKETLRQSCISALRKFSEQGSISQKQKRSLLTDIITCSARRETSMVEVAYELLLDEVEERSEARDVAEEEFADQCRVFADELALGH